MTRKHNAPRYARVDTARLRELYTIQHLTLDQISTLLGPTKAALSKALKRIGVSVSSGTWVELVCSQCGQLFKTTRSRWRSSLKHYCTIQCYAKSMENPNYRYSRQGQRMARARIAEVFDLQVFHVVHHHDSDTTHNELSNLAVFASQAEHMSFERGGLGRPIFDGREFVRMNRK